MGIQQMNISDLIANARFTVLLGKNGAGKSTLLRTLVPPGSSRVKYVTPERGGTLTYEPNIELTMSNNPQWLVDTRRVNRSDNFRQQSVAQFRSLEMLVLREIEKDHQKRANLNYTFDTILAQANDLLPAIKLVRSNTGFSIASKDDQPIAQQEISSGESELISLVIEILVFARANEAQKILLLDEPDVHLHPDLQQKFIRFTESISNEFDLRVAIATHSTAVIGAFTARADLQIAPVTQKGQQDFHPFRRQEVIERILPVFGAHPLSSMFQESPVVLVEGDDDQRVIEQIVRSSNGAIFLTPCPVNSVDELYEWETWLANFLPSIYDAPVAYSLRDLDDTKDEELDDIGCVCRIKLNCYAMENFLLCSQSLGKCGYTPDEFVGKLKKFLEIEPTHRYAGDVKSLVEGFENRRLMKIKNVRNIIVGLLGTSKPWEVLVGQLIAANVSKTDSDPDSLQTYLGQKAIRKLFTPAKA